LEAHAVVRVDVASLPELRRQLGPVPGQPLPQSFLKHVDEQTLVGLAAVFQAIQAYGLDIDFRDWGVLGAPRFLGRPTMAVALERFLAEGAWGVSPHLIPHRSLHSLSGTVSQALKIHGPNFGVGGGPGGAAEGVLAAAALLVRKQLPGVWLVLTCLDPDHPPDDSGRPPVGTHCVGLALALTAVQHGRRGVRVRVCSGVAASEGLDAPEPAEERTPGFDLLRLECLLDLLQHTPGHNLTLIEELDPCSWIELSSEGPDGEGPWQEVDDLYPAFGVSPLASSLRAEKIR
jgi:hypothetical protein